LSVGVILHHDHEDVVEMRNAFGNRTFLRGCRACDRQGEQKQNYGFRFHGFFLSWKSIVGRPGDFRAYSTAATLPQSDYSTVTSWLQFGEIRRHWRVENRGRCAVTLEISS